MSSEQPEVAAANSLAAQRARLLAWLQAQAVRQVSLGFDSAGDGDLFFGLVFNDDRWSFNEEHEQLSPDIRSFFEAVIDQKYPMFADVGFGDIVWHVPTDKLKITYGEYVPDEDNMTESEV